MTINKNYKIEFTLTFEDEYKTVFQMNFIKS